MIESGSSFIINLWDIAEATCTNTLRGHKNVVFCITKLNENMIASGSIDCKIKLWDIRKGECTKDLIGHRNTVYSLININDNVIASGSDTSIKLWDLATGKMHYNSECTC